MTQAATSKYYRVFTHNQIHYHPELIKQLFRLTINNNVNVKTQLPFSLVSTFERHFYEDTIRVDLFFFTLSRAENSARESASGRSTQGDSTRNPECPAQGGTNAEGMIFMPNWVILILIQNS